MIPKVIHYVWLGGKEKTKLTKVCINSWYRNLSDYEIIEWNESNLDLDNLMKENKFLKKCVELKLWAFVSDYLRLYLLYREGGIYLDTDVEVLKSYSPLLNNAMFVGLEANEYISTAVIGAEKGNAMIKRLLDFYEKEIWEVTFFNNPIIFRSLMESEKERFVNCRVYPVDYFSPYDPQREKKGLVETKNTYSIHWLSANWNMSRKGYVFLEIKHIKNPIKRFFVAVRKNLGYWRK